MGAHKLIQEADNEIRVHQDTTSRLKGMRKELALKLVNEVLGTSYKAHDIEHGTWTCPDDTEEQSGEKHEGPMSPTGKCVYVPESDPCRDDCIFCHGPDERK